MHKLLLSMCLACVSLAGFSQSSTANSQPISSQNGLVPPLIKFGGVLHDAQGNPVSGTSAITFSIYADQTGGSALWTETQTVQFDAVGHYSVLLGSVNSQGVPVDIFSSGAARWLGVQLGRDGEPEQPRSILVSVPYAMKSGDADSLGGRPASDYALAVPVVGLEQGQTSGTSSSTSSPLSGTSPRLSSGLSPSPLTSSSPVVTPGGTTNFLSMFSDSTTVMDSGIIDVNGNIGIGIAAGDAPPQNKLEVRLNSNQAADQSSNAATFTNTLNPAVDQPTSTQEAFVAEVDVSGTKNLNFVFGNYSVVSDLGSGTRNQVIGLAGEIFSEGAANVNSLAAISGYADNTGVVHDMAGLRSGSLSGGFPVPVGVQTFGGGTTTNQYGVWVLSNINAASTVVNNYGIKIEDQGAVGNNNWALRTGSGLVQFGDRTVFAPATANASSLNIPAGTTPGTLIGGDLWNNGGVLQFYDGSASKSLAFVNNVVDLSSSQTIGGAKNFSSTIGGNISGNASTATFAGNVTGVVGIANGGTGSITSAGARAALAAASSGANADITSLSGLSTPLTISQGGTGSGTQNFVDLTTAQAIGGVKTFSAQPILPAPTTGAATVRFLPGVAPASPVAGDFWNMGASLQYRDNAGSPATHTLADLDSTQTLTNKTISGASNTFTNLPNSAFANNSLTVSAGSGLSGGGSVALGGTTTLSIPSAGVSNAMLANNSITVTAGTGLSGGGTVALGGSVTLTNEGVASVAGTANQISPTTATTGAVTLSFPVSGVTLPGKTTLTGSAASTASLNIPTGTAPTTPAIGDIWSIGTSLQFRDSSGVTRSLGDLNSTQALSNKTLDTASGNVLKVNGNTLTATAGTATITVPNSTDTLVARATTDTLTNKTIDTAGGNVLKVNGNLLAAAAGTATLTFPNSSDTMVARSTADILSNKGIDTANGNIVKLAGNTLSATTGTATVTVPNVTETLLGNGNIAGQVITAAALNLAKNTCSAPDPTFTVNGVTTSMVVVVSPAGPIQVGWDHYTWNPYVESANTVGFHVCNGTSATQVGAAAQNFNLRIID